MVRGKREFAARAGAALGLVSVLGAAPKRNVLLVLNYHRIGNPDETLYDPGVFSATAEEFDDQVRYLKRHFHVATAGEVVAMATGETPVRPSVLITFDDGYLDNYTLAFPVLRSHNAQGLFFLPTSFIGTAHLPFWDVIAYLVRHSRNQRIQLTWPDVVDFDLATQPDALMKILRLSKTPAVTDLDRFIAGLQDACGTSLPPEHNQRRFMNWDEAREMHRAGMAFGSHTHNHEILAKLSPVRQSEELRESRITLERELGRPIDILSYPDGSRQAFSPATVEAARANGYRAAFSFYGGMNRPGDLNSFDIRRCGVERPSASRFRLQTTLALATASVWF
jgi:peptidoglycan/xylan/chitin deacetylase (PgdA/CDA1 family)